MKTNKKGLTKAVIKKFERSTLRLDVSYRGGGIEIDLAAWGWPGVRMTAYQNYLGGGMLGRICNDCTISDWQDVPGLVEIAETLGKYFHSLTNHSDDEWESETYEQNQHKPASAY